ncbi:MAG: DinB family protein [Thermoflexibacter sp.]|jgi:hypothetical protein|nr:DinB family protein [Thermoflexibacter sp.]
MNTLLSKIDKITEDFTTTFGMLSEEQLNWKPNAQIWSIAQNMNHLIVVGESYYPTFQALKKGTYHTPFIAKIGFIVSFLGKVVLDAVQPDRRKKMKTFPIWEPATSEIEGDILAKFKKYQSELKAYIEDLNELAAKGVAISSPANRNIVYKLSTAFEIMTTHEQRHLEQAKEVLALMKK